jgi:hypothetical protein
MTPTSTFVILVKIRTLRTNLALKIDGGQETSMARDIDGKK